MPSDRSDDTPDDIDPDLLERGYKFAESVDYDDFVEAIRKERQKETYQKLQSGSPVPPVFTLAEEIRRRREEGTFAGMARGTEVGIWKDFVKPFLWLLAGLIALIAFGLFYGFVVVGITEGIRFIQEYVEQIW